MNTTAPEALSASAVIALVESGAYPRDVIATIARGFLPLGQEDLIGVLVYLAQTADAEIVSLARKSLGDLSARVLVDYAANEAIEPGHLVRLMHLTSDALVLESLMRNRSVPDSAVVELAVAAEPRVQEVIVINQARILRAPGILESLLANPALTTDVRRRAIETRDEFFVKRGRPTAPGPETEPGTGLEEDEPEIADIPLDPIADLLERAAEQGDQPQAPTLQPTESEQKDPK